MKKLFITMLSACILSSFLSFNSVKAQDNVPNLFDQSIISIDNLVGIDGNSLFFLIQDQFQLI